MKPALNPADDYSASVAIHEYEEAQAEADREIAEQLAKRNAARDICDRDVIEELTNYYGVDTHAAVARCMRNLDRAILEISITHVRLPAVDALTTALSNLQRDLRATRYKQIYEQCLTTVRGE